MESSKHNWANISETICPEMLARLWQVVLLDVILSEYPDKSQINFFMTSHFRTRFVATLQEKLRNFCFVLRYLKG